MFILILMVCVKFSKGDELEDIISQSFNKELTSPAPTVSGVAQFYTTDTSNFTEVTLSDFFVDKSLLIKELLDPKVSAFLEISAAPHFGKSTNLNMMKRFLEITVDDEGRRVSNNNSENYNTFTSKLGIYKYKDVFDSHFGKYPVLFVDNRPLETVTKFHVLLNKYKIVLHETFLQHKYLLNIKKLWKDKSICKNKCLMYFNKSLIANLNQTDIEQGFTLLIELLYKYYKTPVVALVDDYDIIIDAPVSEDCRDLVFNFTVDMNNRIIESKFVSQVILSGSLLRGGIPYSPIIKSAMKSYPQLLKYYGLNKTELHLLLQKFFNNSGDIEEAERSIVKNYSGYVRSFEVYDEMTVNPKKDILCSAWSVLQYVTCVKKINVANIGETGPLSLTYLCIRDRARLIETF